MGEWSHGRVRLTARRDAKAAKALFKNAIERIRRHRSVTIVTDKVQTYWRSNPVWSDHAAMTRFLCFRQSFRPR
uniref:DDE-type integrase/transposase/recombinase n=1 Tax=Litoreibacter arenae TaxID=491388 RepID=UPI0012B5F2F2|nr:DDE-type integrase/transposase/recombinase [Litoreibacter arenae]